MEWALAIVSLELIITWIMMARCESRQNAIAWSLFWPILIPIIGFKIAKHAITK